MTQQKFIIPGAVLGILLLGYIGLSFYASGQAEKRLEDWLYDNQLDGQVRWESVSSTPFGGTVTLKGVTLAGNSGVLKGLDLDVEKIRLSDLADERDLKRLNLELSGIRIPETASGRARGLVAPLTELLHNSGRRELSPFDLALSGRYDAKDRELDFAFSLNLPQLLATEGAVELRNARNLERAFAELGEKVVGLAMMGPQGLAYLPRLEQSVRELQGIELGETSFSLRDQGYFKRSTALNERYNYSLDPSKGDADRQRQAIAEREQRAWVKNCSQDFARAYRDAEQACNNWWLASHGQSKGIRLSLDPKNRLRLSDLAELGDNPERAARTLERLNLKVDKL